MLFNIEERSEWISKAGHLRNSIHFQFHIDRRVFISPPTPLRAYIIINSIYVINDVMVRLPRHAFPNIIAYSYASVISKWKQCRQRHTLSAAPNTSIHTVLRFHFIALDTGLAGWLWRYARCQTYLSYVYNRFSTSSTISL